MTDDARFIHHSTVRYVIKLFNKLVSLTGQALVVDGHIVDDVRIRTARHIAASVDELTARLVVTQRFNRQPVLRVVCFNVFHAVIDGVRRTARNPLVTARLQELTVDGAGDEDGASVGTGQTDGVLETAVSAVDICRR